MINNEYSRNDWRNYIAHAYDWSTGKNSSAYNHDYYEKHKDEILAKRRSKNGSVRDFGGKGVGYKSRKENTTGDHLSDYEDMDDWSSELTEAEKKNIEIHNAQVDKNISDLTKIVDDYIAANKDKLSDDQVNQLRRDLATQISIANEQRINTKNSDDYQYIMEQRKKAGISPTTNATSLISNSVQSSTNSSTKKVQDPAKQDEWKRLTDSMRKEADAFAARRAASRKK